MLRTLALGMLLTLMVVVAVMAAVLAIVVAKVARSNRVDPKVPTPAPLHWTLSPGAGARLHRRLQNAAVPLTLYAPADPVALPMGTTDLARRLVGEAVETDRSVVLASRLPRRARRNELRGLSTQVRELEVLSRRIIATQRSITALTSTPEMDALRPRATDEIAQRLDMLDAAQAELAQIERQGGLTDPEAILRENPRPPVTHD